MYPPKFNLYRISRGIKKPIKEYLGYHVAKEKSVYYYRLIQKVSKSLILKKIFLIILYMNIITQKGNNLQ